MSQHDIAGAPPGHNLKQLAAEMLDVEPMRMGQVIFGVGLKVRAPFGNYRPQIAGAVPRVESLTSAFVRRVREELKDDRWDFRTVGGIANTSGLSEEAVRAALALPGVARRPWGRPGTNLFTSADRPVSMRERLSLLDIFIAKRP
jgi:hypothetical protein